METGKISKRAILVGLLGTAVVTTVIFSPHFATNDDTAIRDILSGAYTGTPSGHCIQLLYPLGALIAGLYGLIPGVPWFGALLFVFQWMSLAVISLCLYKAAKRTETPKASDDLKEAAGKPDKADPGSGRAEPLLSKALPWFCGLITVLGALLFYRELVFVQYTTTAGLLMAAAISIALAGGSGALAASLAVISFNLRSEMMLFLLPFLGLALLYKLNKSKESAKGAAGTIGALVLLMAVSIAGDSLAYGSAEWRQFRQLFDARTDIYDYYGVPAYEDSPDIYAKLGLSGTDYELLKNYNIDLSDKIDADTMTGLSEYAAKNRPLRPARQLYEAVYAYVYRFTHGQEAVYDLLALSLYVAIFITAVPGSKELAFALLTGALRTALWIFLLYRGRVPERITHPLYMAELIFLAMLLFAGKRRSRLRGILPVIIIVGALINVTALSQEYGAALEKNSEWEAIRLYCEENSDNLYYMDVYSTVAYTERIFGDVAGGDPVFRNFDTAGGWRVKSPLTEQRYAHLGKASGERFAKDFDFIYNPGTGLYPTEDPVTDDENLAYMERTLDGGISGIDLISADISPFRIVRIRK